MPLLLYAAKKASANTLSPTLTGWSNLTKPTAGGIGSNQTIKITGNNLLGVTAVSISADAYVFTNVQVISNTEVRATSPVWPWSFSYGYIHFKKAGVNSNNWIIQSQLGIYVGSQYN